jgi:metallo-beta-lactamase family protein
MHITCFGAAGEVTGSCYWLRTARASVLIDCGLFQGSRATERKNRPPRLSINELHGVVLTHAHLDHCGRLPLLWKAGYRGPIHTTAASADFAALILRDAARVQADDLERINRKRQRAGQPPEEPLYEAPDVEEVLKLMRPMSYNVARPIAPGVAVRLVEAGHMMGSASVEALVQDGAAERTIVFSGDLGPRGAALLRDPEPFRQADAAFVESTYGDRDHKTLKATLDETAAIIEAAVARRGRIYVPVFAVGRTQQLLYHLAALFRSGRLKPFPIYLDSPMAIEATRLYARHQDLLDEEATALAQAGSLAPEQATLHFCPTAEDSKRLNDRPGPFLVMAGAGMCNAGRILHHLRNNLARPDSTVLIVGYQSEGSLGRQLVDGKKEVTMFGATIPVRASIHTLGGFSAHAGQTELYQWVQCLARSKPKVYLTHGEDRARLPLGKLIEDRLKLKVGYPKFEEKIEV